MMLPGYSRSRAPAQERHAQEATASQGDAAGQAVV